LPDRVLQALELRHPGSGSCRRPKGCSTPVIGLKKECLVLAVSARPSRARAGGCQGADPRSGGACGAERGAPSRSARAARLLVALDLGEERAVLCSSASRVPFVRHLVRAPRPLLNNSAAPGGRANGTPLETPRTPTPAGRPGMPRVVRRIADEIGCRSRSIARVRPRSLPRYLLSGLRLPVIAGSRTSSGWNRPSRRRSIPERSGDRRSRRDQ
jgi:hypothetical protein